ncbi:MAG: DUF1553 domain-containing protein [Planctomycetota bacterium]|nr:DUF1553 domain-containing protein [Planctomycetota bacterium]
MKTLRAGVPRSTGAVGTSLPAKCGALALVVLGVAVVPSAAEEPVDFNRDVRPILSGKCFFCHGPDKKQRKADLRLDTRTGAFRDLDGYSALVPGDPQASELYLRITAEKSSDRMPPRRSRKTLSGEEIALIKRWIEEGARWQEHWAFVAPRRPSLPEIRQVDWVRNPVDRFVLARLEREGIEPSKEVDRFTLIRRVCLDVTGLPPSPDEVDAFVVDDRPDAYERLVDRLLSSPSYGEHKARFWLDAARYGDTHGLHLDNLRIMWLYRDWVIGAFNRNLPYDRFTVEQLAGDLLEKPTREQRIATGFNRCNVTTSEGGAIDEEFYVRYAVDRVETTATVFMGLTAGCAVCHDHKFDPISQKEFYQLFAYFNNIKEPAMDGNKSAVAPFIEVPLPGVEEKREKLSRGIVRLEETQRARETALGTEFDVWLREVASREERQSEPEGLLAHYPLDGEGPEVANAVDPERGGRVQGKVVSVAGKLGKALKVQESHLDLGDVGDFESTQSFSYGAWLRTPGDVTGAPIARMNPGNRHRGWDLYVVNRRVAMHLIHSWSDSAVKVTTKADVLEAKRWHHVFVTYDGGGRAGGVKIYVDGEERPLDVNNDSLEGKTTRTKVPLYVGKRHSGSPFTGGEVDDVRVYGRQLSAAEVTVLAGSDPIAPILAVPEAGRTAEQQQTLRRHYLQGHDEAYKTWSAELVNLRRQDADLARQTATTLVMEERETPRGAYVLERGQYDQRGEKVEPGTPAVLPAMPAGAPPNRLGFARWLVDGAHPLTARVAVNRLWQETFGTGLVRTSEDFGSQGEPPSHPRLLDWLATEFVRLGWDLKEVQRLLVTSATYRQSSRARPELLAMDPHNRLLARGPRYRLDAEVLRDQALAVSGLLVRRLGGPSVRPPQPAGLWYAVGYTGSNTVRFKQDAGDAVHRRGLYTFWKRTAPPPAMSTLDAPSREKCTVRRERTNTPLQALLLMNDVQYFEAARHLAQRVLRHGEATSAQRAIDMFRLAAARPPQPDELEEILKSYREHLEEYRKDPDAAKEVISVGDSPPDPGLDPPELAAWTLTGNLILNLDEVINKN